MIKNDEKMSPMMKRYLIMKEKYKDVVLFYRLGDFYEMFFEDAEIVSKELDLTLTKRSCGNGFAPMCGVPYHAVDTYIKKLIDLGHKVAICEQLSQPKAGTLVDRDVIRVISAGTVSEDNLLEERKNNYLMVLSCNEKTFGVAYSDISTGEFKVCEFNLQEADKVNDMLIRVAPTEILGSEKIANFNFNAVTLKAVPHITYLKDDYFKIDEQLLTKQFGENYKTKFELTHMNSAIESITAILKYLGETQMRALLHIKKIEKVVASSYMVIDINTRRNLELIETIRDRKRRGSLLGILDNTKTSMGGRLIRNWVEQPLTSVKDITFRQNCVSAFMSNIIVRDQLTDLLTKITDIERIGARIAFGSVTPRDLLALRYSLEYVPQFKNLLQNFSSLEIKELANEIDDFSQITDLLQRSINEEAPSVLKDGKFIKSGFNSELDEYRTSKQNADSWMLALEAKEKEATGIKGLKVSYNRVFGYYIEVNKSSIANVPLRYERKQTVANNERYITQELKELEEKILGAEEKAIKLEQKILLAIRDEMINWIDKLQIVSKIIAKVDCFVSFANVAIKNNYSRPLVLAKSDKIIIEGGRHPVVEAMLKGGETFIENDTLLDCKDNLMQIITGPNMAGKSTYMRQVAVITIMAQIGSFVPVKSAEISVIDRIFTRVGASDDLAFGQSTFMVEMSEVATILANATSRSLVVLDEIGRGTSTFDGLSIAQAVVEYICKNIKCKTLFATHYHELADMEEQISGIKSYKILIKEMGNSIVFLRKIVRGGANKSFGIEVAKLAGVPNEVVARAKEISKTLEEIDINKNLAYGGVLAGETDKSRKNNTAMRLLDGVNINNLTPIGAFDIVSEMIKIKGE